MSKLKNVFALCHAVGFDLFCPPVSTLGRRKQRWNLWGAGDKVVQGLNNLSIYCPGNVGCLWDASILCRKTGMITYIEYTSNSLLNFCFLLHHHMSSKGSLTLGDLFDMDMDLGSHKTSQQWTSCRQCCVFPAPFLPGLRHGCVFIEPFSPVVGIGCVFTRILATNATLCVFIEPFSPVVRKGCVFTRIVATNATLCVFIDPF